MDCHEPVDDYCEAWQAENLQIPEKIPSPSDNLDQFFIVVEVETTSPFLGDEELEDEDDDDEEKDEYGLEHEVEDTNSFTFWAPCPRIEHENLTKDRIRDMLSRAGVPLHKQEFMIDKISARADEMANAAGNKDMRVLPMKVSISIVACMCCGETIDD